MAASLTIAARFNGPPASGHGGYTAGRLAAALGAGGVGVSLRMPPPLGRPLGVVAEGGGARLLDGDAVVAEAAPAPVDVDPPPAPVPAPAGADDPVYGELHRHPFPTCFGCGPDRAPGDGLRIFATRVPGRPGTVAAAWTPDPGLSGADGIVDPAFAWAALDCPSGHACAIQRPAVLARLAVRLLAPVRTGVPHVVAAWRTGRDGRKHTSAACLHAPGGTPVAVAEALWIELRDPFAMGAEG